MGTSTRLEWTKNEQHSPGDTSGTERSGERKWSHRCGCPSPGPAEDSVGKVPRVPGLSGGQVLQPLPGRPWIYPNLYSGLRLYCTNYYVLRPSICEKLLPYSSLDCPLG